ncbi:MAG: hypothetical protein JKY37_22770 [Nannocystaceae bacterium]|nr:hypothetical protein [Nannocystaceae bacterium]
MDQRLARVRESLPETGPGKLPAVRASGGHSADDVAEEAGGWLARAARTRDEFPRRYAIARGYLALRTRPDAVAVLLERLVSAPDTDLAAARQLLLALLLDRDGRRQSNLRLHAAVDAAFPDAQGVREAEAQRRRRFAVALRL